MICFPLHKLVIQREIPCLGFIDLIPSERPTVLVIFNKPTGNAICFRGKYGLAPQRIIVRRGNLAIRRAKADIIRIGSYALPCKAEMDSYPEVGFRSGRYAYVDKLPVSVCG